MHVRVRVCGWVCVVADWWDNAWLFFSTIKNYSPSLILTNSLSLPLLFQFLSLLPPPFQLLALPPTHAYIGMEMRESCTLAANIQIQSVRPHKKKKPCFMPAIESTRVENIAKAVYSKFFVKSFQIVLFFFLKKTVFLSH